MKKEQKNLYREMNSELKHNSRSRKLLMAKPSNMEITHNSGLSNNNSNTNFASRKPSMSTVQNPTKIHSTELNLISERSAYKNTAREVKVDDRSDSQDSTKRQKFVSVKASVNGSLPVSRRDNMNGDRSTLYNHESMRIYDNMPE